MEFSNLNKEQQQAVECAEGPLLVLAGAGSGKTRVLVNRIACLIRNHGVRPWNILALTFTNKAAREMRERIEALIGEDAKNLWVSTFHSCCTRILRREAEHIGYDKSFVIYDDSDQLSLYADIIKRMNLDDSKFPKRLLREQISQAKNHTDDVEGYLRGDAFSEIYLEVYRLYQKRLKQNNALDFDDLLLKVLELFTQHPDVLEQYRDRFKYILVDEYQDTNMAQYKLVRLLSEKHRNICVVGDDDQSIYGWRGADIRNILEFEKDFPGARVIRLEQNYRSTSVILDAANNVINNNQSRKRKKLWTSQEGGEHIRIYQAQDERMEADYVCSHILAGVKQGRRYDDFAVLYRTNAQSRALETALTSYGIPHRVYGGQRFYERAEIKDILAYMRLLFNPADDVAFLRVVNVPRRGIGQAALAELSAAAEANGLPLFLTAMQGTGLSTRVRPKLQAFTDQIEALLPLRYSLPLHEFVQEIVNQTAYEAYLREDKKENYEARKENVSELLGAIRAFEEDLTNAEEDALGAYLENVSLISDIDDLSEQDGQVALMTLHSAKGLEFPVVFITGMEEFIFPGRRSRLDPVKLEEERRLCYVGITRAMEELHLLHAQQRNLFGELAMNPPSRFLEEIPSELCEEDSGVRQAEPPRTVKKPQAAPFAKTYGGFGAPAVPVARPQNSAGGVQYQPHQRVKHAKFGIGTVLQVEGAGSSQVVTIDFGGSVKKFAAAFAPIQIDE
ncbi:MAG: DNA helicase PcrA [Bacillota bacterium]